MKELLISGSEKNLYSRNVIEAFFNNYSLEGSKEALWLWLKTTVTGNYCRLPHLERDNLISFYEELSQLIDAVWELHQNQQLLTPDHPKGGHDE